MNKIIRNPSLCLLRELMISWHTFSTLKVHKLLNWWQAKQWTTNKNPAEINCEISGLFVRPEFLVTLTCVSNIFLIRFNIVLFLRKSEYFVAEYTFTSQYQLSTYIHILVRIPRKCYVNFNFRINYQKIFDINMYIYLDRI